MNSFHYTHLQPATPDHIKQVLESKHKREVWVIYSLAGVVHYVVK